ncbi:hypothetical protein D5086_001164 [Populus alba]|uniref:Uncharacterized protein n=1 Tax=Populus alba TaxID=43335 RepID=A0ACC4CYL8_POPAL
MRSSRPPGKAKKNQILESQGTHFTQRSRWLSFVKQGYHRHSEFSNNGCCLCVRWSGLWSPGGPGTPHYPYIHPLDLDAVD